MFVANTFLGGQAASAGGTDKTPGPLSWNNINARDDYLATGATNSQTISGIDTTISLKVSWTGSATLQTIKNGVGASITNGGSIDVANADTLAFTASSSDTTSGTVTVVNMSDTGTPVLDGFSYTLTIKSSGFA